MLTNELKDMLADHNIIARSRMKKGKGPIIGLTDIKGKQNKRILVPVLVKEYPEKKKKNYLLEINILNHLKDTCKNSFVCIIDSFQENGKFYLVIHYDSKYMELAKYIENFQLNEKQTIKIAKNIAKALIELNNLGVAHMDIKPQNILINPEDNSIKIIDFDMSCLKDDQTCFTTKGTPNYLSPDMLKGKVKTFEDAIKSDTWSFGVTLYFLFFKKTPWKSTQGSSTPIRNVYRQITDPDYIIDYENNPEIEGLLSGLIERNPRKRISLEEFLAIL